MWGTGFKPAALFSADGGFPGDSGGGGHCGVDEGLLRTLQKTTSSPCLETASFHLEREGVLSFFTSHDSQISK